MSSRVIVCFFTLVFGIQAQTAAQNLNAVRWSTSVDLANVDSGVAKSGSHGTSTHYGAPVISAANTVFVPVRTAAGRYQINAVSGTTGVSIYTLSTDYVSPATPSYSPVLAASPSGARLYYAGAGGSVYYIGNPDSRPVSAPVQQVFYGLSDYQGNRAGFNSSVFINTPITSDTNGNIFFGFGVRGTAPAPLNTAQSGFARIDPSGKATYILTGAAAGDSNIARNSRNSTPALSNDQSTLYVLAKAATTDSSSTGNYGYLLGLDSVTLATKYKTVLKDPRNGNFATISDDSTASPMVAPDNDVYLGVLGGTQDNRRGFLLHFNADLTVEKVPGAFGGDFTPAMVPATMVTSYTGSSSYLIFSKYNDYPGDDGGQGVSRIALLDPNSTQLDPHPSSHNLTEMREVLTASSITPDAAYVAAGFPLATSEWSFNTAAVNPANNSIYVPNADGHIYRWDLSANSLSQSVELAVATGLASVPVAIGPDGTVYTIHGSSLFAVGGVTGTAVSLTSSAPDLRSAVAGQAITFTVAVADTLAAGVTPRGTVTFQDVSFQGATPSSTTLGAVPLDATGHASLTTSGLGAGGHFITATYSGGAEAASAAIVQSIHASATSVTLSSSPDHTRTGALTLTATVVPSSAFVSRVPSGMVAFTEDDNVVAQIPLSAGVASFTAISPRAGNHIFGAVYSSDGVFAASAGTLAPGTPTEPSRASNAVTLRATPVATSSALRPRTTTGGMLAGIGDYSQNPANLTLEGTADWIHWGDSGGGCTNQKASAGSASQPVGQLSTYKYIVATTNLAYPNDARPLSWTDGYRTSTPCSTLPVSSDNYPGGDPNGVDVVGLNTGFSFTAPADTTVRTLVVHAGGYSAVGQLTAILSDGSAPNFVDTLSIASQITASYDRNYVLTYKAASAGQHLTVSWVNVNDLGTQSAPGNVSLSAAALSLFTGKIAPVSATASTAVNTAFTPPLQVTVTDANGSPVSGATVTFTAPAATTPATAMASFTSGTTATAVTDTTGTASAPALTANTVTGSYYVTASVPGVANTAEFVLTNTAGPPFKISPIAGTPASALVNTAYTTALQALVIDSFGNPVSGATVTFGSPTSGPSALFATGTTTATAMTNASGIAFAPTLTANGAQGLYLVTASVAPGVTPAPYFLTNTPGGGFLVGAGINSSATVNLTAVGTSDWSHWGDPSGTGSHGWNHKATGGQIVDFSYVSTVVAPARIGAHSVETSNSEGVTKLHPENMGPYSFDPRSMNWSDGTPQTIGNNTNGFYIDYYTYLASGINGFTFTAPADLTARTLTVYVGGNNSGGTLVAHLSDGSAPDFVEAVPLNASSYDRNYTLTYNAGAAGKLLTVTWTMTSGTGNVTLSGAAVALGIPSTIAVTAGSGQGAVANAVFGAPLQATVYDTNGHTLSGVNVTFFAQGTGASANFNGSSGVVVTTNSSGVAMSPLLTANGVVGAYTVIATLAGAQAPAVFNLYNVIPGGSMLPSVVDSFGTTANLTAAGAVDWVHWGTTLIHKSGVSPQIGGNNNYSYSAIGSESTYPDDKRILTWTDGAPTGSGSDTSGVYTTVGAVGNGYSFTVPADMAKRTLTVYVGGYVSAGMLTAHLSDQSAADYVDTTLLASGQFDRNYTLTYNAASPNQTLTITWVSTVNMGNVTLNGAALSLTPPTIATYAGTPQSAQVNTPFATLLQAKVLDASGNPLPVATVTFTVQTGAGGAGATFTGSSLTATAVTNALGIATAPTLTANGITGNYTVTATVPTAVTPATFNLGNFLGGGSLSGSGNSSTAAVSLTAVGTTDWIHWGDSPSNTGALIRKSGVSPQFGTTYSIVGTQAAQTYPTGGGAGDPRSLSWTDGTPVMGNSSDVNGLTVYYPQNGFSFTVPADGNQRTLSVYVGGYNSAGTLTATLSDLSAAPYVDTTSPAPGQYDRNYTLTFSAASPNRYLTVSWVSASPAGTGGNVTFSAAALSGGPAAVLPWVQIDAPVSGAVLSGVTAIGGWAIENTSVVGPNPVSSVALFVDGAQVGTATYGNPRTDVCAIWPGRQGCPNVGWTYNLDTTALTAGSHTLKIVATDSAGVTGSSQVTFTANAPTPFVDIEAPVAGASLSGVIAIGGWAIENTSYVGPNAVSSVTVFVDGAQVGTASYGNPRGDVCAIWPGRPGCPNVGWTYNLNTTALAAGSHTLKIVATDSAGVTGSSQVTFSVNTPTPFVDIDAPVAGASLSGVSAIGGWAIENTSAVGPNAIATVTVFVDGGQVGTATYGNPRGDVCAIWPGRLGCPNVGWTYNLNTTALASGSHTLKIVATDLAGTTGSSQVTFTANAPSVNIDAPVAGASLSGVTGIGGWAIENTSDVGPNAVSSVAVFVDGTQVGMATYGNPRTDVCAIWPGRPACPNVGWTYNLNTTALASGSHTLKIVATDSAGTTGSSQVTFTANAPTVNIEAPVAGAVLSGVSMIGGWAIENTSDVGSNAVSSVAVFVDGAQVGTATYGNPRPDVCAIWPGRLGCPNVGWTYNLDTTVLAFGSHTLKIVATDSAGTTGSSQTTFTTGGPSVWIDAPVAGATLSGVTAISGWAIESMTTAGPNAIANVTVLVDGSSVGTATYGGARSDVCLVYPGRPGCPSVGWTYNLDTTQLAFGSHTLNIVATDTAGYKGSTQTTFVR